MIGLRARVLLLASLALLPAGATAADRLAVGDAAPALALGDQAGRPVRLEDLLRQRDFVVVAFYVKAFTGG